MKTGLVLPISIIVAGIIIAVGVYSFVSSRAPVVDHGTPTATRAVTANDHILGNPLAPVMFVEYSDIDCPYCKNFRSVMEHVVADYGPTGNVAWAYRHLPISDQHPNAESHAEAAECVAVQGGTSAFFRFIDALNTAAPDVQQFNPSQYSTVIQSLGLNTDTFSSCLQNHTYKDRVAKDAANAIAAGASGVPYTILLIKGVEQPVSISGAFSYDQMKQIAEEALQKAGVK